MCKVKKLKDTIQTLSGDMDSCRIGGLQVVTLNPEVVVRMGRLQVVEDGGALVLQVPCEFSLQNVSACLISSEVGIKHNCSPRASSSPKCFAGFIQVYIKLRV